MTRKNKKKNEFNLRFIYRVKKLVFDHLFGEKNPTTYLVNM